MELIYVLFLVLVIVVKITNLSTSYVEKEKSNNVKTHLIPIRK